MKSTFGRYGLAAFSITAMPIIDIASTVTYAMLTSVWLPYMVMELKYGYEATAEARDVLKKIALAISVIVSPILLFLGSIASVICSILCIMNIPVNFKDALQKGKIATVHAKCDNHKYIEFYSSFSSSQEEATRIISSTQLLVSFGKDGTYTHSIGSNTPNLKEGDYVLIKMKNSFGQAVGDLMIKEISAISSTALTFSGYDLYSIVKAISEGKSINGGQLDLSGIQDQLYIQGKRHKCAEPYLVI